MDSGQSKITKPKLARSQVRLRVLAARSPLLSPFGVMNVWAIGKVLRARHAAARVRSLGGQVSLLPKQGELLVDPEYAYNESMVLGWHRAAFGDTSALRVSFSGSRITDADLVCLDGFRRIYMLSLDNTLVTDAGLDFLAARSEIQTLSLKGNNITDAGLKLLEGLANLKSLDLSDTKVTDQGLAHLEGLGMLTELNLPANSNHRCGTRSRQEDTAPSSNPLGRHTGQRSLRGTASRSCARAAFLPTTADEEQNGDRHLATSRFVARLSSFGSEPVPVLLEPLKTTRR